MCGQKISEVQGQGRRSSGISSLTVKFFHRKLLTSFNVNNLSSKTLPVDRKRTAITPGSIQAVQDMLDMDCGKENTDPDIYSWERN